MTPNRAALITGASSGIGKVFAQRFAQSGYDLIITGRRKDKLILVTEQLEQQYGIRLLCLCPGFTHTDFHERRAEGEMPKNSGLIRWMEAETVVEQCMKSLEKGKIVYIPGFMNRMMVRIVSLIPHFLYYKLMMKITGKATKNEPATCNKSGKVKPIL